MKVYLGGKAAPQAGGMYRVYDMLFKHLPELGVEIVDTVEEADVVHAHISVYEKIPTNKPLVVSSHGLLWSDIWGDGAWGNNLTLIEAYRQADVVTAPSKFVADAISRNMLIKPLVVHHGIDPDEWIPGNPQGYVLWNKARIDAANDPTDLNELAKLAPDVKFVSTFGVETENVKIIGQVSPEEMKTWVQGASVYLDTARESGGPCFGVLEAMSCGIPILAWNEGGNAEAVEHLKTGYLAQPKDFNDLLKGLRTCLDEGRNLGKNARKAVENKYTYRMTCEGYIEAYRRAVEAHKHPIKVSVIVPVYNLAKYLPMCLDSIQSQTFTDWEAIIVNDASPDNALEIAETYVQKDIRFKVLNNKQNLHVSESRNRGVLASRGKYILPLDADDRLTENALEKMVEKLDSDRSVDIVSGLLWLYQDGYFEGDGPYNGWPNNANYDLQITGYNRLPYSSMYRRKVWENIGGYRRRIRTGIEDGDFWTRALSFGYRAEVIQTPTLKYTLREHALHEANTQGVDAWLSWFPWSRNPEVTPFGALGIYSDRATDRRNGPYHVLPENPLVSIIIPVGPGHAHHIQGCIDSLISQTNPNWEAIVVNDTGERWFDGNKALTHYVLGMPFVKFVDFDSNHGVAFVRNRGIEKATANKIVFLDVDDTAQPDMVEVLLQGHALRDGWIYGDWYTDNGKEIEYHRAPDWTFDGLCNQSLAPITGIYHKQHLLDVGLFDETIPGWEDWDMQLKLLEQGICGTRIEYPLITYNMHLGARRESNFADKNNLVQLIKERHIKLYRGNDMGCSKCGGGKTLAVATQQAQVDMSNNQIWMMYEGPEAQDFRIKGEVHNGVRATYIVNNHEPFAVLAHDVDYLLNHRYYKKIESPKSSQPTVQSVTIPLTSQAPAKMESTQARPISVLQIKPEIITLLSQKFGNTEELKKASDADLLSVRGIGNARVREIRQALAHV